MPKEDDVIVQKARELVPSLNQPNHMVMQSIVDESMVKAADDRLLAYRN